MIHQHITQTTLITTDNEYDVQLTDLKARVGPRPTELTLTVEVAHNAKTVPYREGDGGHVVISIGDTTRSIYDGDAPGKTAGVLAECTAVQVVHNDVHSAWETIVDQDHPILKL